MFLIDKRDRPAWAVPAGILAFIFGVSVLIIDHWPTIRSWFK